MSTKPCHFCRRPVGPQGWLCSYSCAMEYRKRENKQARWRDEYTDPHEYASWLQELWGLPRWHPLVEQERQAEAALFFPDDEAIAERGRRYGLDLEETKTLLKKPCAVCLAPPTYKNVIDHDHRTGKVRGALCISCNSAFAGLDKIERLGLEAMDRALEHLKRGL